MLTDQTMSYDGHAARRATFEVHNNPLAGLQVGATESADWPKHADGSPEPAKMTSAPRYAYHRTRHARQLGDTHHTTHHE